MCICTLDVDLIHPTPNVSIVTVLPWHVLWAPVHGLIFNHSHIPSSYTPISYFLHSVILDDLTFIPKWQHASAYFSLFTDSFTQLSYRVSVSWLQGDACSTGRQGVGKIKAVWAGSRVFSWAALCSPVNILCFKMAPGFIHSDTIQSRIFPPLPIIVVLIFHLDYKPIPAGFSCVASFLMAEMGLI